MRVAGWQEITRSMHPSMVGRVGRSIGAYSAAVWKDGAAWHWQIWERMTGRSKSSGIKATEREAKLMASRCLKEQAEEEWE